MFMRGADGISDVVRAARRKNPQGFLTDAAEARWVHSVLAREWQLANQHLQASNYENHDMRRWRDGLNDQMHRLLTQYGREWR
jgi:hypothetical protein